MTYQHAHIAALILRLATDVDLNVFTFNEFGKGFPKSMKLSPDGFIQNAILLTYYR
jgi:hypothetical protein